MSDYRNLGHILRGMELPSPAAVYQPPAAEPTCGACRSLGWVAESPYAPVQPCAECGVRAVPPQSDAADPRRGDIPDNLRGMNFGNFQPDGAYGRHSQLRNAFLTAQSFAGRADGCLVLSGGPGSGKTHLAAAAAGVQPAGRAHWANAQALVENVTCWHATEQIGKAYELLHAARGAGFLVMDALGTERLTEFSAGKLSYILRHRLEPPGLLTIITTGLTPDELRARYPWLASLLGDRSVVSILKLSVEDYRRSR